MERQQFCTFYVAQQLFGVEVERVQEIIRHQQVTRVPLAPPAVSGLINLRGQIVPVVDLRRCLELEAFSGDELSTNVVLRTEDGSVSLAVDEIGDVLEVSESAFEMAPDNLRGTTRELLRGVYKLEGGLLLVLATETAITLATSGSTRAPGATAPLTVTAAPAPRSDAKGSLFDRLGGAAAITAAVDRLYLRLLADAQLRGFFEGVNLEWLKRRQVQFFSAALGGPASYQGRTMKQAHEKLPIEARHFAAVAEHLATALRGLGVAEQLIGEVLAVVAPLASEIVTKH